MTDKTRMAFAVIVTAVFLVAAAYLVSSADTRNQQEWERLVYVFGAIEAIAFAAVGWVFGTEVNRKRAESAEKRADEEQEKKDAEVGKGRTLAGMVVGGAEGGGGGGGGRPRLEAHGESAGGTNRAAVDYAKRAYGIDV